MGIYVPEPVSMGFPEPVGVGVPEPVSTGAPGPVSTVLLDQSAVGILAIIMDDRIVNSFYNNE